MAYEVHKLVEKVQGSTNPGTGILRYLLKYISWDFNAMATIPQRTHGSHSCKELSLLSRV